VRSRRISLAHPWVAGQTGIGVSVAVVDSGIVPGHPHVGRVDGGVCLEPDGTESDAFVDRLGDGTAVAAAIREKAPGATLIAVKVFDRALATNAELLARGIVWAAERGARLINLSLGTANHAREAALRQAVERAVTNGAIVVSAYESNGTHLLPGSLTDVAGVLVDWESERDELALVDEQDEGPRFRASGYPRPIAGVPPERNLSGVSFAVANVTGFLARLLERESGLRSVQDVARRLAALA